MIATAAVLVLLVLYLDVFLTVSGFALGGASMTTRPSLRCGASRGTCAPRRMSSAAWRAPAPARATPGHSTRRGRPRETLILGVALLAGAPAAAQRAPSGAAYGMGLVLTRPLLDARAQEPFEQVGRFRAGPGMALWLRFDGGAWGASAAAEAAGLDVGPEILRDGISMGRQAAVYAAFAGLAHWRPARAGAAGWRPEVFAGPVLTSLGEVAVRMAQLPPYARDSTAGAEDTTAVPTGIRGRGVRLGVALERTWAGAGLPGDVSLRAEVAADRLRMGEMEHGGRRVPLPRAGTATFPRLVVGLTWRPTPGSAPRRDRVPGAAAGPAPRNRRGRTGAPVSQEASGRSVRPAPGVLYD